MSRNNIISHILLSFLLFLSASPAIAQDEKPVEQSVDKSTNYVISIHPGALFWGGLKFDFNKRLKEKQWIQVTPTVYLYPSLFGSYNYYYEDDYYHCDYENKYDITDAKGIGLDFSYMYFLDFKESFYLKGTLSYSYFNVDYAYYDYIPFEEDGLPFYTYGKKEDVQNFNRLGFFLSFGVKSYKHSNFYIDFNVGLGYQYAFYNKDKAALDKGIADYGYRGFLPTYGVSLGYAW